MKGDLKFYWTPKRKVGNTALKMLRFLFSVHSVGRHLWKWIFLRDSRGSAEETARGNRKDIQRENQEGRQRGQSQGKAGVAGKWAQNRVTAINRVTAKTFPAFRSFSDSKKQTIAPDYSSPQLLPIIISFNNTDKRKSLRYTEMCKQGMEATHRKPPISSKSIVIPTVIPNYRLFL